MRESEDGRTEWMEMLKKKKKSKQQNISAGKEKGLWNLMLFNKEKRKKKEFSKSSTDYSDTY